MGIDKRVIRTRKAITTAYMQLALEKDLGKITVSDIAERAVINRSTFYLHYADANDVLDDIKKTISKTVEKCFREFDPANFYDSTYKTLLYLTGVLDETPAFKDFMLKSTSSGYIIDSVKQIITEMSSSAIASRSDDAQKISIMNVTFSYMISGVVDAYIAWTNNFCKDMDIEEFCRLITILSEATLNAVN